MQPTPDSFYLSGPIEPEPEYIRCECGELLEVGQDEIVEFEGSNLCTHCYETQVKPCIRCGDRDWIEYGVFTDDGFLCSLCQRKIGPDAVSRAICKTDLEGLLGI